MKKLSILLALFMYSLIFILHISNPNLSANSKNICSRHMPKAFVDIKKKIPSIIIDIRYATKNNFVGEILDGFHSNCAWGMPKMVKALKKVQMALKKRGYGLKVYDSYRPMSAERHMIRWGLKTGKRKLFGIYIPSKVNAVARFGHTCGNMIDLTIVDNKSKELNMGTDFDEFTKKAHTFNARGKVYANRMLLKRYMERYGFKNYTGEWWHYNFFGAPYKALNAPVR